MTTTYFEFYTNSNRKNGETIIVWFEMDKKWGKWWQQVVRAKRLAGG